MKKKILTTMLLMVAFLKFVGAQVLPEKLIGVWELPETHGHKLCLVFIDSKNCAYTATNGLVLFNFTYKLAQGNQQLSLKNTFPYYIEKNDSSYQLIQLRNDSTLLINTKNKGKRALSMEGKTVSVLRKMVNVQPENFVKRPTLSNLIGSWYSIIRKDTIIKVEFKTNNVMAIKAYKPQSRLNGTTYKADFEKQPMTLDFIDKDENVIKTIFHFQGDSLLYLAGPKDKERRTHFTFFGDNMRLDKQKL